MAGNPSITCSDDEATYCSVFIPNNFDKDFNDYL